MALAAALISFGLGLLVGRTVFRRASRDIGPSWEDWLNAELIGGRWKPLIRVAAIAAPAVGLVGFGAPGAVRAALLGAITGFCLPFAVEGVRRHSRARRGLDRSAAG
jgi:hypothetical protein